MLWFFFIMDGMKEILLTVVVMVQYVTNSRFDIL
jgi:hypothetical protein